MPSLITKNFIKISSSTKNALMGGCLLNPNLRLLPQAKASIVSNGKLMLVKAWN